MTLIPTVGLLIVTMTAGYQKLFHENPKIGFLSHAKVFQGALDEGKVLAPAKNVAQMKQIIFNDYIDAALCGIFMIVVIAVLISALRIWIQVLRNKPMPLKRHHIFLEMKVSRGTMLKRLRQVWGQRKHFISLLVGVPSYETYVEHMKKHHPEEEVVCQKQFFAEAQEARFNAKGGKISRCC